MPRRKQRTGAEGIQIDVNKKGFLTALDEILGKLSIEDEVGFLTSEKSYSTIKWHIKKFYPNYKCKRSYEMTTNEDDFKRILYMEIKRIK